MPIARLIVSKFVISRVAPVCEAARFTLSTSEDPSVVSANVLAETSLLSFKDAPEARVKLWVAATFKSKVVAATLDKSAAAVTAAVNSSVRPAPPDKVLVTVLPPKSSAPSADLIRSAVLPDTVNALLPAAAV